MIELIAILPPVAAVITALVLTIKLRKKDNPAGLARIFAFAALAFGIDEFLYASDAISLVEWPERIEGLFPPGTIRVMIERTDKEETRKISIEKPD